MNKSYTAVAIDHKILIPDDESKEPSVGVRFRCIEGDDTGKEFLWYGSLHENAQQYTVDALRVMGWTGNDITTCEGLGGTKFRAVEKHEEYRGRKKTKYMIFPLKSPRAELSADAAKSFADRYKALAVSVPALPVTEQNAAPEVLPPPAGGSNGASNASPDTADGGTPF